MSCKKWLQLTNPRPGLLVIEISISGWIVDNDIVSDGRHKISSMDGFEGSLKGYLERNTGIHSATRIPYLWSTIARRFKTKNNSIAYLDLLITKEISEKWAATFINLEKLVMDNFRIDDAEDLINNGALKFQLKYDFVQVTTNKGGCGQKPKVSATAGRGRLRKKNISLNLDALKIRDIENHLDISISDCPEVADTLSRLLNTDPTAPDMQVILSRANIKIISQKMGKVPPTQLINLMIDDILKCYYRPTINMRYSLDLKWLVEVWENYILKTINSKLDMDINDINDISSMDIQYTWYSKEKVITENTKNNKGQTMHKPKINHQQVVAAIAKREYLHKKNGHSAQDGLLLKRYISQAMTEVRSRSDFNEIQRSNLEVAYLFRGLSPTEDPTKILEGYSNKQLLSVFSALSPKKISVDHSWVYANCVEAFDAYIKGKCPKNTTLFKSNRIRLKFNAKEMLVTLSFKSDTDRVIKGYELQYTIDELVRYY